MAGSLPGMVSLDLGRNSNHPISCDHMVSQAKNGILQRSSPRVIRMPKRASTMKQAKWVLVGGLFIGLILTVVWMVNPVRTMASLKKVDDNPLFVATYYGDYGFEKLLNEENLNDIQAQLASGNFGCSTFAASGAEDDETLGRNFDWLRTPLENRPALLLLTHPAKGYRSISMVDLTYLGFSDKAPTILDRWNLLEAPYFPFDGMNEAGLAVGMMAIERSSYEGDPQKKTLGSLEIIRAVLDKAGSVSEAVEMMDDYNINFRGGPAVHYLLADRSGESAAIEYIDGEMKVLKDDNPWQVSTNFIISEEESSGGNSGCSRYNHLYQVLADKRGVMTMDQGMTLLEDVSQDNAVKTMWSVVYNLENGKIKVVMGRDYEHVLEFNLVIH